MLADATVEGLGELVGFENHGGRTYLGPGARAFARVEYGYGNNGDDGTEGAREGRGPHRGKEIGLERHAIARGLGRSSLRCDTAIAATKGRRPDSGPSRPPIVPIDASSFILRQPWGREGLAFFREGAA